MRWQRLFDDLEAQLEAADAGELLAEVADRTRHERAQVALADRLVASTGSAVVLHLAGGTTATGVVSDVAQHWCVLEATPGPLLVPLHSVRSIAGLGPGASLGGRDGVRRRMSFGAALRGVARDRSAVLLGLVDGTALTGTVDVVAADHLDLAEHPPDEPRRARTVRGVRTVPFAAVAWLRPTPGSSSLANR